MIEIVRGLGPGDYFEYHGEIFDLQPIKIAPVPAEPIPIIVGGHAEPALRRAARLGDGWIHAGGDGDALAILLDRLAALRREYGRERELFEVHAISSDAYSPAGVRRLEDSGVTDVVVGFRWPYDRGPDTEPLQQKIDALTRYADTVIAAVST
jgi:alkanesulfonate monooxygenase SsuD/methylene tetrahydromethanopterin reductase-like flavin-dependent oxidoreductase (luciferase family)